MRVEYRIWQDVAKPLAGKIILRPESPEEEQGLRMFRDHIASPQKGRKFEIIYKRRVVSAPEIHRLLRERNDGR